MQHTYRFVVHQWEGTAKGNHIIAGESHIPTLEMAREHASEIVNTIKPELARKAHIFRDNPPFLDEYIETIARQ